MRSEGFFEQRYLLEARFQQVVVARQERKGHASFHKDVRSLYAIMPIDINVQKHRVEVALGERYVRHRQGVRNPGNSVAQVPSHFLDYQRNQKLILDDEDAGGGL